MFENYLKYSKFYQVILHIFSLVLIRVATLQNYPVYAESILDYLPRHESDGYDDPFEHPVVILSSEIPIQSSPKKIDPKLEPVSDGNLSAEDAAYNQKEIALEQEFNKRVEFLDAKVTRIVEVVSFVYPSAKSLADIPFEKMRSITYTTLSDTKISWDWLVKSEADIRSRTHPTNQFIQLIEFTLEDPELPPLQREALCHVATYVSMLNSGNATGKSQEFTQHLIKEHPVYNTIFTQFRTIK